MSIRPLKTRREAAELLSSIAWLGEAARSADARLMRSMIDEMICFRVYMRYFLTKCRQEGEGGAQSLSLFEAKLPELIKETMPCYVDGLHWLVSDDEAGNRYLTIFNNAGNERDIKRGDVIIREADRTVTVTFKDAPELKKLVEGVNMPTEIQKIDEKTYKIKVPATSFVVLSF